MAATIQELKVPYRDQVLEESGILSKVFQEFFKFLKILLDPLGLEKTYSIENNKGVATKINGFVFNKDQVRQVFVEYFIQRVTSSSELIESGRLRIVYKPKSLSWHLQAEPNPGPDVSGIVFSINASGEILYTSTNMLGTPVTSKVSIRNRTLSGKNQQ